MKKKILLGILFIFALLSFFLDDTQSTDLSSLRINDKALINTDESNFKEEKSALLGREDSESNQIFVECYEQGATLNDEQVVYIEDVTEIVGKNYQEDWKDYDQRIKRHTYEDRSKGLVFYAMYEEATHRLVWLEAKIVE